MTAQDFTQIITTLGWVILGIILAALVAWVALKVLEFIKSHKAQQNPTEAPAITETMRNLSNVLAEMERDSSKASLLLLDAQTFTQTLVNLIQGVALKAESMAQEIEGLQAAVEAIAGGDPLQIARAAGGVKDEHIRTLMICKVRDSGYWLDVSRVINTQLGTLALWEKGYRDFTSNLLAEVSKAKSQLAGSTAALELMGTARPMLQAQANLNEATALLQIQRKPGLYQAARSLPAINAGLLR